MKAVWGKQLLVTYMVEELVRSRPNNSDVKRTVSFESRNVGTRSETAFIESTRSNTGTTTRHGDAGRDAANQQEDRCDLGLASDVGADVPDDGRAAQDDHGHEG